MTGISKSALVATTALDVTSSLDSLLSPKGPTLTPLSPSESVAESDYNDVTLEDDSRFSTVPLSERASIASDVGQAAARLERRTTISSAPSKAIASHRQFVHKRSVSSVTADEISGGNILAWLGIQKARDENDLLHAAGDGQQKLHEEFLRLHDERRAEAAHDDEASIDWGQSKLKLRRLCAKCDIASPRFLGQCHLRCADWFTLKSSTDGSDRLSGIRHCQLRKTC